MPDPSITDLVATEIEFETAFIQAFGFRKKLRQNETKKREYLTRVHMNAAFMGVSVGLYASAIFSWMKRKHIDPNTRQLAFYAGEKARLIAGSELRKLEKKHPDQVSSPLNPIVDQIIDECVKAKRLVTNFPAGMIAALLHQLSPYYLAFYVSAYPVAAGLFDATLLKRVQDAKAYLKSVPGLWEQVEVAIHAA